MEEALDLATVEVDSDDAVGTHGLDELGDSGSRDGDTWLGLTVLTGITVVGHDGGDALGRGETQCVDEEEELHEVLVDVGGGGLDHVDVGSTDVVVDVQVDFAISKLVERQVLEADVEELGDIAGQLLVGLSADETDVVVGHVRGREVR